MARVIDHKQRAQNPPAHSSAPFLRHGPRTAPPTHRAVPGTEPRLQGDTRTTDHVDEDPRQSHRRRRACRQRPGHREQQLRGLRAGVQGSNEHYYTSTDGYGDPYLTPSRADVTITLAPTAISNFTAAEQGQQAARTTTDVNGYYRLSAGPGRWSGTWYVGFTAPGAWYLNAAGPSTWVGMH